MSTWLTAILLTIIAVGFVLTAWLRREGDRAWAEHQRRQVFVRLVVDVTQFNATMRRAMVATADFERSMRKVGEVVRRGSGLAELKRLADSLPAPTEARATRGEGL